MVEMVMWVLVEVPGVLLAGLIEGCGDEEAMEAKEASGSCSSSTSRAEICDWPHAEYNARDPQVVSYCQIILYFLSHRASNSNLTY